MRRILGSIVLTLALIGCGQPLVYVHPTKDMQQFYADESSCKGIAGSAAGPYDIYSQVYTEVYMKCMFGRGWRLQESSHVKEHTKPWIYGGNFPL